MGVRAKTVLALGAVLIALGPAAAQQAPAPPRPQGFLSPAEMIDALALLPPPPAAGSLAEAADLAAYRETRALEGGPRWAQAIADVPLRTPEAYRSWSCAAGVEISPQTTPATTELMQKMLVDAGLPTYGPKNRYARPRPMEGNDLPVCVARESLAGDWSYPSGHAAVGWAWGLVLAELRPDHANAIVKRGYDFGDSRVVCGVHYPSDVQAGRAVGAAAVARLHAHPEFQAAMGRAKTELAQAPPAEGCGD